jgi:hypothetical protein
MAEGQDLNIKTWYYREVIKERINKNENSVNKVINLSGASSVTQSLNRPEI